MQIPILSAAPGPEGRYPVNWYLESEDETGRPCLKGTPGMVSRVQPSGRSGEVRGLHVGYDGLLYVVVGGTLYSVDTEWAATARGSLSSEIGHVQIADNGFEIVLCDGSHVYTHTPGETSVASQRTASSAAVTDTFVVVSEPSAANWYKSGSNDATSWDETDFGTATGAPDDLVAVAVCKRQVWLFGTASTEAWYNAGTSGFPFERAQGSFQHVGLAGRAAVTQAAESLAWLDGDRRVVLAQGYLPVAVSTPELAQKLAGYADVSDAVLWRMVWQGHEWLVVLLPTANRTWVRDLTTGTWFQWSSGLAGGRVRANCYTLWDGKHLVGDSTDGTVYELGADTYTDSAGVILRERTAPAIRGDRKRIAHHAVEVVFRPGVGLAGEDAPQVMLDWSDDEGKTWSSEHWTDLGAIGEYERRARWTRLGASRTRTYRVRLTEPVEATVFGATIEATPRGS